jgi:hypothetical protein
MAEYFSRIDSALDQHQMPAEYVDHLSLVFCNDCENRSLAKYHFMYHKCSAMIEVTEQAVNPSTGAQEERKSQRVCSSYNTKVLQTFRKGSAEEAALRAHLDLPADDASL